MIKYISSFSKDIYAYKNNKLRDYFIFLYFYIFIFLYFVILFLVYIYDEL